MSGETKWTKGPWKNWGEDEYAEGCPGIDISTADEGMGYLPVAYIRGSGNEGLLCERDHANAALIIEAPNLYAALATVTRMLSDIGRGDAIVAAITNARQVMARARGEQP